MFKVKEEPWKMVPVYLLVSIGPEKQWNSEENISTEHLRLALKRYRSFFERLLTLEA